MIRGWVRYLLRGLEKEIKPYLAWVPLTWRQGATYRRWRKFLASSRLLAPEEIEHWQLQHLKNIVMHAYNNTRGYKELFAQSGVLPQDIRQLSDIRSLPFITKEVLRDNIEDFSVVDPVRFHTTTGGSTGIPFGFYLSYDSFEVEDAFIHDSWASVGWKTHELNAVLRGAFVGSESSPWELDRFRNELLLSSYHLSKRTLHKYISAIKHFRPRVLQAYPSALNILCDLLNESGVAGDLGFELILLGSENTYDWLLEKAQHSFPRAKIFSWYGHSEHTIFAPWCEHTRDYHISPFYGFTEIIGASDREVNEGEEGELVGTSFHMWATPFVRYRTMDRAIKGGTFCPSCGRWSRRLTKVLGRSHEVIVTATGRYISMTALNMHNDVFNNVRQFQFYQNAPGKVIFRVERGESYSDVDSKRIYEALKGKLGEDMELSIEFVDDIPKSRSGKYRFLDQKLPIEYHDR